MAQKHVVVALPPELYRTLAKMATENDRLVEQQAAFLLRQAIQERDGR